MYDTADTLLELLRSRTLGTAPTGVVAALRRADITFHVIYPANQAMDISRVGPLFEDFQVNSRLQLHITHPRIPTLRAAPTYRVADALHREDIEWP
jgi:hypothetical protein